MTALPRWTPQHNKKGRHQVKATSIGPKFRAVSISALAALGLILSGCQTTGSADDTKLIVYHVGFPCGLNDYATQLCNGITETAAKLPPGYKVEIKSGVDYLDSVAFNNAVQTTLERKPAGLLIFATGAAANIPILQTACDAGVKVITIDVETEGIEDCLTSHVGADNVALGVALAEWQIDHPTASKEVATIGFPPGQAPADDQRVQGFKETITAAGYDIVSELATQLTLDQTRTQITNLLTAHPNLGVIFTSNSIIAAGVHQALDGNTDISLLTVDGVLDDVPFILDGTISAEAAQAPYLQGQIALEYMVKVLEGGSVPKLTLVPDPTVVLDKDNVQEFADAGGIR